MVKSQVIEVYLDQLSAMELPVSERIVGYVRANPRLEKILSTSELIKIELFLLVMGILLFITLGQHNLNFFWRYLFALALGYVIFKLIKVTISRRRPWMFDESLTPEQIRDTSPSFPSGHALILSAVSVVLLASSLGFAIIVIPYTVLVLAGRVASGLHFPTDVIAGISIGISVGSLALVA